MTFFQRQIIAMQGPFSAQMNECILREYSIDWMVTKISGHAGGFEEKIEAAKKAGVGICAILPYIDECFLLPEAHAQKGDS